MTPQQERALLDATSQGLDDEVRQAYQQLIQLIREGQAPRDAVQQVIEGFSQEFAETLSEAFTALIAQSVGSESVLALEVGTVSLSRKLYAQAQQTAGVVQGVVERHTKGFQDARRLALELFEGYGFRDDEVLSMRPGNQQLPQYLRTELLRDPGLAGEFQRLFARIQADERRTPALRAAYLELIDAIEQNAGWRVLEKKLETAFYERMRYFANRIAQTELHRAFAQRQAAELLDDQDVDYVQWRLSPTHDITDICDYFAGVDRYGLGRGVYPKRLAPVAPAHPHCRCVLSPRLDLTGRRMGEPRDADRAFFRRYSEGEAARIAGSRAKLAQVMGGQDPWAVHNASVDPQYRVRSVEQTVTAPEPVRA